MAILNAQRDISMQRRVEWLNDINLIVLSLEAESKKIAHTNILYYSCTYLIRSFNLTHYYCIIINYCIIIIIIIIGLAAVDSAHK
jgi:hypothetical protein